MKNDTMDILDDFFDELRQTQWLICSDVSITELQRFRKEALEHRRKRRKILPTLPIPKKLFRACSEVPVSSFSEIPEIFSPFSLEEISRRVNTVSIDFFVMRDTPRVYYEKIAQQSWDEQHMRPFIEESFLEDEIQMWKLYYEENYGHEVIVDTIPVPVPEDYWNYTGWSGFSCFTDLTFNHDPDYRLPFKVHAHVIREWEE